MFIDQYVANHQCPEGLKVLAFRPLSEKLKKEYSLRSLRLCGEKNQKASLTRFRGIKK